MVVAVIGKPPNTLIYILAAVGAFLLLLALLALLVSAVQCRKRRKEPGSPTSSDHFVEDNVSSDDMSYTNDMIISAGGGEPEALTAGPAQEDALPAGESGGHFYQNVGEVMPHTMNGEQFSTALAAKGIVITSGVQTIDKKKFKKKSQTPASKPAAKPDSNEFELSGDKKVATVISRLANRLRNRLSSVRFSGSGGSRPGLPNDESPNNVIVDPSETPGYVDPVPPQPKEPKKNGEIPPNTHRMPRGYAPASHNVPREVRTTWGKAKSQAELHKVADKGIKFGTQI